MKIQGKIPSIISRPKRTSWILTTSSMLRLSKKRRLSKIRSKPTPRALLDLTTRNRGICHSTPKVNIDSRRTILPVTLTTTVSLPRQAQTHLGIRLSTTPDLTPILEVATPSKKHRMRAQPLAEQYRISLLRRRIILFLQSLTNSDTRIFRNQNQSIFEKQESSPERETMTKPSLRNLWRFRSATESVSASLYVLRTARDSRVDIRLQDAQSNHLQEELTSLRADRHSLQEERQALQAELRENENTIKSLKESKAESILNARDFVSRTVAK